MQFGELQRTAASGIAENVWNLLAGSTRSGKTEAAVAGTANYVGRRWSNCNGVLVSRSHPQMQGVLIPKLKAWGHRNGIRVADRQYWLEVDDAHGGHNRWWKAVASDNDQDGERIQGQGYQFMLGDEATRIPRPWFDMCVSRTLETGGSGPRIVLTCNPAGPDHWLYTDILQRIVSGDLEGVEYSFPLTANPSLSPASIEAIAASYPPGSTFAMRMLEGRWVADEGVIHPHVTLVDAGPDVPNGYEVALDYAPSSVTASGLFAYGAGGPVLIEERKHDGRIDGPMKPHEQAEAVWRWATAEGTRDIRAWIVPADADGIMEWLAANARGRVVKAVDNVTWGITQANIMLSQDFGLKVARRCVHTRSDLGTFMWSDKRTEVGDSIPDKASTKLKGAHFADMVRYFCATLRASMGHSPQ